MTATKGERTRHRIVEAAAPLFNQRGYVGSSLSELMAATGLEKGGIYRHFASKDDLALAAFDHTLMLQTERIRALVDAEHGLAERLTALARGIAGAVDETAVPGGCPLLNTAIESDDGDSAAHAALRKRARTGLRRLIDYTRRLIEAGIASGEISSSVDAKVEADAFVGAMEGAVMLSKVYDDPRFVRQAVERVGVQCRLLKSSARR